MKRNFKNCSPIWQQRNQPTLDLAWAKICNLHLIFKSKTSWDHFYDCCKLYQSVIESIKKEGPIKYRQSPLFSYFNQSLFCPIWKNRGEDSITLPSPTSAHGQCSTIALTPKNTSRRLSNLVNEAKHNQNTSETLMLLTAHTALCVSCRL